jgi:hypothetical protein
MNLYYAMGGGLGHLTRARAFLHTLNLQNNSVILTSSNFAADSRVTGDIPLITVEAVFEKDLKGFQQFLLKTLNDLRIETLFIDSFPFGIIGEFAGFDFPEKTEINYVARLLKWNVYSAPYPDKTIKFRKTFILEPLEPAHQTFINLSSQEQTEICLSYPTEQFSEKDEQIFQKILKEKNPFWLIVHAGSVEEINELIGFADEMRRIEKSSANMVLVSPNNLSLHRENVFHTNIYPASPLFKHARRIYTACGFNSMQQTRDFRDKHYFVPFERRFDDQFARAKRFR